MKRKRKNILAIVCCLLICMCAGFLVNAENVPEDQRVILEYYQAIEEKDWDAWLSVLGTAYAENMRNHLADEHYQSNERGVFAIDSVLAVSSVQKIDMREYESIIDLCEGSDHELYLVEAEFSVDKENDFYFDGTNYNLVIVGTVDGNRKIVGIRLPLAETIEEYKEESDAIAYEIMRFGVPVSTYAISASCSYNTTPSTITVCRWYYGDGTCEEVDFKQYVKTVLAAEYGYVAYDEDYHYAGTLAIKMYAWYKILISDPNDAYHVTDTNKTDAAHRLSYQVYNPDQYWNSSTWGTLYTRVDAVWSKNVLGTGYRRMNTQYRAGEGAANTGVLYQETAHQLANQGESYYNILNYFYGDSGESSGDIILKNSGEHVYASSIDNGDGTRLFICKCGYKKTSIGSITPE